MVQQSFGGLHEDDIEAKMQEGRELGFDVRYELSPDGYHYEVFWE